ncbi:Crp/Fnr family transcriptional regulator [Paenibacillus albidus]|uniref:Crp/Fnr family transcriptional regulator n=1 Tax=Paenibacillus albidus TaxID=2041023 RepID=UPI001BECCC1F|nr:Crp/Fnr family transcriptional regulator [Paenibacillus albidus]MBT2291422.1 Crp/Fnr family transcriptional regulator [Paenibacillus albidus]
MEDSFWAEIPLFQGLSPEEIGTVCGLFTRKAYSKGKLIFAESDPGANAYVIHTGILRVFATTKGREHTVDLFGKGDFFGDLEVIHPSNMRLLSAVAMSDMVVFEIRREPFERMLADYPAVNNRFLLLQMDRLILSNRMLHEMKIYDARARTIFTLGRLYQRFGAQEQGRHYIDLRLTHQQIADMIGTLRETTTLVLKDLQDHRIIDIRQQQITVLDPGYLLEYRQGD